MIYLKGKVAMIVEKILKGNLDKFGIFCWTPENETFLLNAEMSYYKRTGTNPYATKDCPKGFEKDAIVFEERLKQFK